MPTKRRVPRQGPPRPPMVDPEELRWVSDLVGVEHRPEEIARVVSVNHERGLWLPDTPEVLPPPQYMFHECLVIEQPFLLHGREKTMKTSLAAHLLVCTAAGLDLFEHFPMMDKSLSGPVVAWQVEGGSSYILNTIDKVCSAYGVRRRDLPIEVQTTAYPLDSPTFLYALGAQVMRLQPRLVFVEPLYLTSPKQWNGAKLTEFNVSAFTTICGRFSSVPGIGHHDKTGDATSMLQRASGVGPAEWAGQWWHIERVGEWLGVGDHQLKLTYGSRGGGAGQVGLRVDDDTLKVTVVEPADLDNEPSGHEAKPTAYEFARGVLPLAMDADDEFKVGVLADRLGGFIEREYRQTFSSRHLRERVIPVFVSDGLLVDAVVAQNEHTVKAGPEFPESAP